MRHLTPPSLFFSIVRIFFSVFPLLSLLGYSESAVAAETCVEKLPEGHARPRMEETFPRQVKNGLLAPLTVTIHHGAGETILPEGSVTPADSGALKELERLGFTFPDPEAVPLTKTTDDSKPAGTGSAGNVVTKVTIPLLALVDKPGRIETTLPPLPITIARASGEVITLCTKAHPVTIEDPVASIADPKPKPNLPPLPQREEWTLLKWLLAAAAVGAVLTALVLWLLHRWKRRPKVVPVIPARPPWEVAMEELEALRRSDLLAQGSTAEYFDRVSDAVRRYLGARYGFDGLESTTQEMRARLRHVYPPIVELNRIGEFLSDCDLVKFARFVPSEADCLGAISRGEWIVRATAQSEGAPQLPRVEVRA